ncbi:MAG: ATP-binding protein [Chitinophagales bacterium]
MADAPFIDFSKKQIREKYRLEIIDLLPNANSTNSVKLKILLGIFDTYSQNFSFFETIQPNEVLDTLGVDWMCIVLLYKGKIAKNFEEAKATYYTIISYKGQHKFTNILPQSFYRLFEICAFSRDIAEADKHLLDLQEYYSVHHIKNQYLLRQISILSSYYINFNIAKCLEDIDKLAKTRVTPLDTQISLLSIKAKILGEKQLYKEEADLLQESIALHKKHICEHVPLSIYVQLLNSYLAVKNIKASAELLLEIEAQNYNTENESVIGQYYQTKAKYCFLIGEYSEALQLINESDSMVSDTKMATMKNMLLRAKTYAMLQLGANAVLEFDNLIKELNNYNNDTQKNLISEIEIRYETEKKDKEIAQLKELDNFKKRFFTNITHDIRTPLSLVLAPLKNGIEHTSDAVTKYNLQLAYANAKKLEYFLNQLVDLNKIEEGLLKPKYVFGNLVSYCNSLVQSLQADRSINFTSTTATALQACYFAQDALEKILQNLVSNALKFSKVNSLIQVRLQHKNNQIILSVKDQGIGIAAENISKIFDRFYQVQYADTKMYQGSGIGLSIVKEYVQLLGGSIQVQSKPNKGTQFIVTLPYKVKIENTEITKTDLYDTHRQLPETITSPLPVTKEHTLKEDTILLVEDNEELRTFLKTQLEDTYTIIEANNGKEGVQKAQKKLPSLIISDIMMPETDGITMCGILKSNRNTNHIPIILLSAKTTVASELAGYSASADAYIKKPFNLDVLKANIRAILVNRAKVQQQVSDAFRNNVAIQLAIDTNDTFLKQFHAVIEHNIYNPSFNVATIAKEMHMNRMTLLRKVKHYTGKKTKEVIMEIRLNTANVLLEKRETTVKNIAYKLGFLNLNHFYKAYKKQFGITPTGTSKNNGNNTGNQ